MSDDIGFFRRLIKIVKDHVLLPPDIDDPIDVPDTLEIVDYRRLDERLRKLTKKQTERLFRFPLFSSSKKKEQRYRVRRFVRTARNLVLKFQKRSLKAPLPGTVAPGTPVWGAVFAPRVTTFGVRGVEWPTLANRGKRTEGRIKAEEAVWRWLDLVQRRPAGTIEYVARIKFAFPDKEGSNEVTKKLLGGPEGVRLFALDKTTGEVIPIGWFPTSTKHNVHALQASTHGILAAFRRKYRINKRSPLYGLYGVDIPVRVEFLGPKGESGKVSPENIEGIRMVMFAPSGKHIIPRNEAERKALTYPVIRELAEEGIYISSAMKHIKKGYLIGGGIFLGGLLLALNRYGAAKTEPQSEKYQEPQDIPYYPYPIGRGSPRDQAYQLATYFRHGMRPIGDFSRYQWKRFYTPKGGLVNIHLHQNARKSGIRDPRVKYQYMGNCAPPRRDPGKRNKSRAGVM